jgi:Fur family ferric uptake transcriptional regulator
MTHDPHEFAGLLRKHGFRVTPQRQLILEAIVEAGGHSSAEEIHARVEARIPGVNPATVYRTLHFYSELGLVVGAEIGGRMVYELADDEPHHHLVCRNCDHVFQIDHGAIEALFKRIEEEQDFTVEMNHLALRGVCSACRDEGAPQTGQ